jgi:AraC-like DNA-binding protein
MNEPPAEPITWVRSSALEGAADLVRDLGSDPLTLALQCGLDPEALYDPDLPVQGHTVVSFFESAAEKTGCADFGIRLSSRQSFAVLGHLWLAMLQGPSVQDALTVLAKFFIVHTNGALVGLELQADGSALLTYSLVAGVNTRDRQTMELGLALLCNELRRHCGRDWMPKAVLFCHNPSPALHSYRRCFGPSLRFNQDCNALWLDAATLKMPLTAGSGVTPAMLNSMLISRADDAQAVAIKVEGVMRALLPFSACSRKIVAQLTNFSQRSLQRRLADAGTTFQQLRDRVRADIALKYLRQSNLRVAEIGEILGYSEPASFTRAFRRQHGFAPSHARRLGDSEE